MHLPIPLEKLNDLDDELSFKYESTENNPDPFDPGEQIIADIEENKNKNYIYEIKIFEENTENIDLLHVY